MVMDFFHGEAWSPRFNRVFRDVAGDVLSAGLDLIDKGGAARRPRVAELSLDRFRVCANAVTVPQRKSDRMRRGAVRPRMDGFLVVVFAFMDSGAGRRADAQSRYLMNRTNGLGNDAKLSPFRALGSAGAAICTQEGRPSGRGGVEIAYSCLQQVWFINGRAWDLTPSGGLSPPCEPFTGRTGREFPHLTKKVGRYAEKYRRGGNFGGLRRTNSEM